MNDANDERANDTWPDLNPERRLVYSTVEAIKALRISPTTFYRHARRLGIRPRKKRHCKSRFYDYDSLMRILQSVYPPIKMLLKMM